MSREKNQVEAAIPSVTMQQETTVQQQDSKGTKRSRELVANMPCPAECGETVIVFRNKKGFYSLNCRKCGGMIHIHDMIVRFMNRANERNSLLLIGITNEDLGTLVSGTASGLNRLVTAAPYRPDLAKRSIGQIMGIRPNSLERGQ